MSGNSVKLGVEAGHGNLGAAAPVGIAVVLFVAGIAAGTVTAELSARSRLRSVATPVLTIEAALIAAFMLYGRTTLTDDHVPDHTLSGFYVLAALGVLAMGIQTAALRQLGGRTISTTYVTGVLTSLTQEAANYLFWLRDGAERTRHSFLGHALGLGSRTDSRNRVLLLGAVWLSYTSGAILGSFCNQRVALWSLLLPLGALLVVIGTDLHRPLEL